MKSMTLTTAKLPIPASIIELAVAINSMVGDQNITVTIHDEKTGSDYRIEPTERRISHEASDKVPVQLLQKARRTFKPFRSTKWSASRTCKERIVTGVNTPRRMRRVQRPSRWKQRMDRRTPVLLASRNSAPGFA